MNMDYSKVFELLNQDTEKERNEKAEKAVHDNLYNKGFRDGLAVLDKIRAEIKAYANHAKDEKQAIAFKSCLNVIDYYMRVHKREDKE